MPGQDGQLAGDGDDRDGMTAPGGDPPAERVRRLLSIPGIGLQTAVGLVASSATSGASAGRTSSSATSG